MYHNKELLAAHLYTTLDDLILTDDKGVVSIDNLLSPQQKYDLIMSIINTLPKTDFEMVLDYNNRIEVTKETTHIVYDMLQSKTLFKSLLEETLTLGSSLDITVYEQYEIFIGTLEKVTRQHLKPELANVFASLVKNIFNSYTALNVLNLTDVVTEGIEEIYTSNLSKIIPKSEKDLDIIKASITQLHNNSKETVTKIIKDGYVICEPNSNNVLEPLTYEVPDLQKLINKHFKL